MSNHDKGLLVLATLLLAVTPTAASAQSIRFHGGVNHSTILMEEEEPGVELGRRLGRHFGVGYAVSLTDLAGLRFEANYHEKGFAADFSLDGAAVGSEAEVTYVEFAPSLVLGGGIIHFLAGPWIAYNLRCTLSVEVAGMTTSGDCDAAGDEVSVLDLGAAASWFVDIMSLPLVSPPVTVIDAGVPRSPASAVPSETVSGIVTSADSAFERVAVIVTGEPSPTGFRDAESDTDGASDGVPEPRAHGPAPTPFTARTRTRCALSFVRPLISCLSVAVPEWPASTHSDDTVVPTAASSATVADDV